MRFIVDAAEADVTASGQIEVGWAVHRLFFRLCLGVGIFGCGSLTSEERKRNVDGGVLADLLCCGGFPLFRGWSKRLRRDNVFLSSPSGVETRFDDCDLRQ